MENKERIKDKSRLVVLETPGAEANDGGHELEEEATVGPSAECYWGRAGLLLERKFLSFPLIFLQSFWVTLPLTHTHTRTLTLRKTHVTAAVLSPFP